MRFAKNKLDPTELLDLYRSILLPRRIEEKMLKLLRQGQISKWFSGIGQEAIAVGVAEAQKKMNTFCPFIAIWEYLAPRNIPLHRLFAQWQGKASGFTQGRIGVFILGPKSTTLLE